MNLFKNVFVMILFTIVVSAQSELYKGPVIDIHCHISLLGDKVKMGDRESNPDNIKTMYKNSRYKKIGIIVIAFKWENEKVSSKNDSLISFCSANSKYFPICSVHPDHGEAALSELDRIYAKGVRFLKLHALAQGIDLKSENVGAVVKRASDLGMVVLFDGWNPTDANMIMKIVELANKNPKGKFIIAHMGGTNFNEMVLINLFKMYDWYHDNIWVDFSATAQIYANSPYSEQIKWTIRKVGVNKVLFGSDYPVSTINDAIKAVESYGFSKSELDAIMYYNSKNLLESVGIK
jgi:uncharacterized protein